MESTTGTIKRITDKGFGFIAAPDGVEYFFHQSACTSTPFDSMREGDNVTFTLGQGPKGPRAENVSHEHAIRLDARRRQRDVYARPGPEGPPRRERLTRLAGSTHSNPR